MAALRRNSIKRIICYEGEGERLDTKHSGISGGSCTKVPLINKVILSASVGLLIFGAMTIVGMLF